LILDIFHGRKSARGNYKKAHFFIVYGCVKVAMSKGKKRMRIMKYRGKTRFFVFTTAVLLPLLFTACGGGGKNNNPSPVVSISVLPKTQRVKAGDSITLTVTVQNTQNTNFTVELSPAGTGGYTVSGNRVTYTAPAYAAKETIVDLTVAASADAAKKDTARITVWADEMVFTSIDYPGAAHTMLYGINNAGRIIGDFYDRLGNEKAFLTDGYTYTSIDNPDHGGNTYAFGINDSGHILGYYEKGYFLKIGNRYENLSDYHGTTDYTGINNSGQLAGYFENSGGGYRGFVKTGAGYTEIVHPDADEAASAACADCGTFITGINDSGRLAGYFRNSDGVYRGFVTDGSSYTPIEHPDSRQNNVINIYITGINDSGHVAGYFWDRENHACGFVKDGAHFIEVRHPDAAYDGDGTWISGINNSGQITGYFDDGQKIHGFSLENLLTVP
jgi:hypothetical protein